MWSAPTLSGAAVELPELFGFPVSALSLSGLVVALVLMILTGKGIRTERESGHADHLERHRTSLTRKERSIDSRRLQRR